MHLALDWLQYFSIIFLQCILSMYPELLSVLFCFPELPIVLLPLSTTAFRQDLSLEVPTILSLIQPWAFRQHELLLLLDSSIPQPHTTRTPATYVYVIALPTASLIDMINNTHYMARHLQNINQSLHETQKQTIIVANKLHSIDNKIVADTGHHWYNIFTGWSPSAKGVCGGTAAC
ncbi:Hypothetical predicted protein [Pelobates cultripes]|uniref:Uncharacterized protein n=1 Tax=Pelobates cultripes TaxID=61616 RepID=A0AAD1REM0_PELCU|nr:Hypothetical predicted protein [Pelobates cultripes]